MDKQYIYLKPFKKIIVKCPLCRIFQMENPHLSDLICKKCYKINNEILFNKYEKVYNN